MNKLILLILIGFIWSAIYTTWKWSKWWLIPISIIFIVIEFAVLASGSDDNDKVNGMPNQNGNNSIHKE